MKTENDKDETHTCEKKFRPAESRNNTMNEFLISVTLHELITL